MDKTFSDLQSGCGRRRKPNRQTASFGSLAKSVGISRVAPRVLRRKPVACHSNGLRSMPSRTVAKSPRTPTQSVGGPLASRTRQIVLGVHCPNAFWSIGGGRRVAVKWRKNGASRALSLRLWVRLPEVDLKTNNRERRRNFDLADPPLAGHRDLMSETGNGTRAMATTDPPATENSDGYGMAPISRPPDRILASELDSEIGLGLLNHFLTDVRRWTLLDGIPQRLRMTIR